MAHVLIMPRQGNTVESCIIGEWKVKEGDAVQADTPVCVVETDKATFEVPSGASGTVLKIIHGQGDDVPVLQPIMVVGNPGENWDAAVPGGTATVPAPADTQAVSTAPAAVATIPATQADVPAPQTGGHLAVSPRAKKLADAEAVDVRTLGGSGPGGRIIEADVAAALANRPPLTETAKDELRKRIAAGLPTGTAGQGTGIGGRLTLGDITQGGAVAGVPSSAVSSAPPASGGFTDIPIKGIRKVIADQMMNSHSNTAAFTLNTSASVVQLQMLRTRFKASDPALGLSKITINDLVLFAASRVLPLYTFMNAHKLDGVVRSYNDVQLGVAVSTPRGLMVPVMRNADKLSLVQISQKARELAEACRSGAISPDDLHGSTFTVTNLGNTGVESFTPVINIPEVAIMGVCGISPKPAETSPGVYEILPHLGLSLTIDHAVVDGAPAAEFLKAFAGAIRDIDIWVAR
jgi:pyruvate dehydrogenase E2 component (dihydrolipoamide acetyltransferase)